MKIKRLSTISLISALLSTTIAGTVIIPRVQAQSTSQYQLIAAKNKTSNSFVTVEQGHPTTGAINIIEENGKRYLEFDRDFSTADGPDVKVVLHRKSTVPVSIQESNYITLSPLQSFDGEQIYEIPNNINLDDYASVAVWCEQFNVTFAYANLPALATTTASGDFVGIGNNNTEGSVTIIEENGQRYVELNNAFVTSNGPDLKVVLHNQNTVPGSIQEGDYLNLGVLQSFNGKQRYAIPDDADLADYSSVAIWCEQFNVTFGYAGL